MNHLADKFSVFFCLQTIWQQIATSSDVSIIWNLPVDNHWCESLMSVTYHGPLLREVWWVCLTMNMSRSE